MFFGELREALLKNLRSRVSNGELTERGLARLVGISQPHMHNLLKGARELSPEISDRILFHLRLSALDLVDRSCLLRYISAEQQDYSLYSYLPILSGRVGPGHPWPGAIEAHERFPVSLLSVSRMWHPVVVRLGDDVRMHPLFSDGDMVLLDQSVRARTEIDTQAWYVLKRGRVGLLRRLRSVGGVIHSITEDSLERPTAWERLPVQGRQLTHVVRARAQFVTCEVEWRDPAG